MHTNYNNYNKIKELQKRCYELGDTSFPIDSFFNDIRDNPTPNFDRQGAFNDLKLIVDEILRLKEIEKKVIENKKKGFN